MTAGQVCEQVPHLKNPPRSATWQIFVELEHVSQLTMRSNHPNLRSKQKMNIDTD